MDWNVFVPPNIPKRVIGAWVFTPSGMKQVLGAWLFTPGGIKKFYPSTSFVTLSAQTCQMNISGSPAIAGMDLNSNGNFTATQAPLTRFAWRLGGASADYEARFTQVSAPTNSGFWGGNGPSASWWALSLTRGVTLTKNTTGNSTGSMLYEIRKVGTTAILASATMTFQANKTS